MDSQAQVPSRQVQTRYLAAVETPAAPSNADPRLEELRGEAMRRLFPKSLAATDRRKGRVALQVHAYLAAATTIDDLERRLRVPSRYPMEWIDEIRLRDGRAVLVRPVLPPDASLHRAFVQSMSATTRRSRFHGGVTDLPEPVLRYLTEIDYVDHLAFIGEIEDGSGARQVAEVRWVRRRDEPERADFAIAVADDYQRCGLGNALLDRLQRSAAAKGIRRLCGHVLRTNRRMIGWLEARGWHIGSDPDDPAVVCAELPLETTFAALPWRVAA